ncbi:ER membrane protein complex subunit 8/9 family protein [Sporobolomyces salmoneus]|uniref:ER membrane protein complex subunit 8/9 family protein n=1 Tax=Sporobolomyces salmoneus TaxID=183962 RepID=UPI00316F55D0
MSNYTLSTRASELLILHAAKHPTQTVCGLLVGSSSNSISDAIPLLHHWTELSAMMEVALQLAESSVKQQGKEILGLYIVNSRIGDMSVPLGLGKVADSIERENKNAVVLMIDNEKLNSDQLPFLLCSKHSSRSIWTHSPSASLNLDLDPSALNASIRNHLESNRQNLVGDFDDHLEDASIDWLTNSKLSEHLA